MLQENYFKEGEKDGQQYMEFRPKQRQLYHWWLVYGMRFLIPSWESLRIRLEVDGEVTGLGCYGGQFH